MFKKLSNLLVPSKDTNPEKAYDLWAQKYDAQPDNLMLALDEDLFSKLLKHVDITNKIVIDVGCGTGRHWPKILKNDPAKLIGYDVSDGMLQKLKAKFPLATVYKLTDNKLINNPIDSADLVISTLTVAHIDDLKNALAAWNRVLKVGGNIIITDYHPAALGKGAKRTFSYHDKTISIKNNVYNIDTISQIAQELKWEVVLIEERVIDDSVKSFYEKQSALSLFESYKGTPIIYGILLKKTNAAQ